MFLIYYIYIKYSQKVMENKKIDIELDNLVVKTYTKIANWYNLDGLTAEERKATLKELSGEIIVEALEDLFNQMDIKNSTETIKTEEKK